MDSAAANERRPSSWRLKLISLSRMWTIPPINALAISFQHASRSVSEVPTATSEVDNVHGEGRSNTVLRAPGMARTSSKRMPIDHLRTLVAWVRDEATQRLWGHLAGLPATQQRQRLDRVLVVPEGARVCDLERWRKGPTRTSGPAIVNHRRPDAA